VIGVVDDGYWLDLGTPLAFAKGSADLVRGIAPSPLLTGRTGEALIESTAKVDSSSSITGGTYIGHNAVVGADAVINGSVIFADVEVGSGTQITNSIVSTAAKISSDCIITDTVIAERAVINAGANLEPGTLVFPDESVN
jgi:mannose-1-phosphate guanylyltransferase